MATLLFRGEHLKVKVTQNVISEMIALGESDYQKVMLMPQTNPFQWLRDSLYCYLLCYNPTLLKDSTKYDIGDELMELDIKVRTQFAKQLIKEFYPTRDVGEETENVASEKK